MMSDPKRYRRVGTVLARRVLDGEESVPVYSLEGPAIAYPGDYILTAERTGESWVVKGHLFEVTHVAIDDDACTVASEPILCAHADEDGAGMHWLASGETCGLRNAPRGVSSVPMHGMPIRSRS